MEKKLLRKRKGQWVTASMAVLSGVALGMIGSEAVQAEENNDYVGMSIGEMMNYQPVQEASAEQTPASTEVEAVEVSVQAETYAAPSESTSVVGSIAELQRNAQRLYQERVT